MNNHYHVTSHTHGALNDNEVLCVASRADAGSGLVREVRSLVMWLTEGCDRDGCGYCGWCQSAKQAAREVSPEGASLLAQMALGLHGTYTVAIEVPGAPEGLVVTVTEQPDQFADCLC